VTAAGADALEAFYDALVDDDPQELYDRAPCGYLSTTPDGVIVKVNQTFLTLTGYTRADLVGERTFAELLSPGGQIYHETHFAPLLRMQGRAREIALDIVRADGSRLPVLVNAVLEEGTDGAPRVIRTAVFDATDRREYERELLRAKARAEESEARARALAQTLQQTFIPATPPAIPGLAIATAYRPAGDGSEVGGDFFDVFQLRDDTWVVAIGDVRGKGVEAAVVTALARHTLRAAAAAERSPSALLRVLNDVLLREETERFCTVACLELTKVAEGWQALVACGGHQLPLMRRSRTSPRPVGAPGTLLGVFPEPDLVDTQVYLEPGSVLFLYTDGATEARKGGELYGDERLLATVAAAGPAAPDVIDAVLHDVLTYQAGQARDDIALVALGVPG
jgi:sigma-B regulation protein RsbU (phosphoserine phosphatase)